MIFLIAAQEMTLVMRRSRRKSNGKATDTMSMLGSTYEVRSLQRAKAASRRAGVEQKPVSATEPIRPLCDQAQTTLSLRQLQNYFGSEEW